MPNDGRHRSLAERRHRREEPSPIRAFAFFTVPASLTAANGNLFFVANDGIHGLPELWAGKAGAPLITTSPQSSVGRRGRQ